MKRLRPTFQPSFSTIYIKNLNIGYTIKNKSRNNINNQNKQDRTGLGS